MRACAPFYRSRIIGSPAPRRTPVRALVLGALVVVLGVAAWAAASAYDHARAQRLAPGLRIARVPVGDLDADAAKARVVAREVTPRRRTVHVTAAGHRFAITPEQARVRADVDGAVGRALAASRRGWLGARVWHALTGHRVDARIPLPVHLSRRAVDRVVADAGRAVHRDPVDASVTPAASGLQERTSRDGRRLDAQQLRRRVLLALRNPARSARITARVSPVAPKVTTQELAAKYPAYIVVDRRSHVLRFFSHLKLDQTFPIAVGKSGLETPAGLYDIQWKEVNPPWRVPNSSWAGDLAGKTIPPGPDDPIKARWMAFNGGAGIHGIDPSEYGSIGHDASHGCVRMRIPDVIALYSRSPVGTPVFVA